MPLKSTTTIVTIFVSSPGELADERIRLEQVVLNLNRAYKSFDLQFNLVKWETEAYPGFASYPQEVINKEIPPNYDIFIGIMWCTVGTETPVAPSGTIEEFELAKEQFDSDPESIRIMFYFKDAPPASLSDIDPAKLQQVNDFKKSLGDAGGLHWEFKTAEDFEQTVLLHLAQYVQDFRSKSHKENGAISEVSNCQIAIDTSDSMSASEDEELGILDYEDELDENITGLSSVAKRIAFDTDEIAKKMKTRTDEINLLKEHLQPHSRRHFKSIVNNVAKDMTHYSVRMDAEIPLFRDHLDSAMTIFVRIVTFYYSLNKRSEATTNGLRSVEELLDTLDGVGSGIGGFIESVTNMPPMTRELNRAKKKTTDVLQRILDEVHSARLKLGSIESFMN